MMKKYLLTAVALFTALGSFAQYQEKCGTDIELQRQLEDPETRARYEDFQAAALRYAADPRVAVSRENGVRIIPVVFHILHEGGSENISNTKIQQQLNVLNTDFARLNPDTVNTPERFYGDTEYTHFVFNSDMIADFVDDSAYVLLHNRYGENFAFHFNNGTGGLADTLLPNFDNVIEVNISNNADTADLAIALRNAINAQNGFIATYVNDGEHRVEVSTDGLGYADDVLVAGLWPITQTITQQGSYLPADSKVEFRLATLDPLGNCTDGVVRVFTSKTNNANNGTGFKAESYWNAYSYLNVWVVRNIDMDIEGGGITLGYAQFPCSGLLSTDGIVVIASNVNVRDQGGRTATHEVGHWLGLRHVWGDAQCGSDDVLDTPTHAGPNFGICGNHPTLDPNNGGGSQYHTTPYNVPGCDPTNPDGEMFMNYMDYSSDACMNMFTLGQKARMDFTLHGDGNETGCRTYMVSQENLELTGVADPYTPSDCAPVSAFYFEQTSDFATQKMICAGEEVQFEENAYNGDVDSYLWTFDGGDPGTDTDDNPTVTYNTPGIYDVTLQVTNAIGSDSHTAEDMIIVSSTTAQNQSNWGYVDSFWDEQAFENDYVVFNQDGSDHKWEWYFGSDGGSTGWESVRMMNYFNGTGEIDELISPSYDLSTIDNATLQFRYSGAASNNSPSDQLRIMVSDDCGETWSTRETISGFDLTNTGLVVSSYVPTASSTWTDVSVNLGSFANKPNVRIKFRWISGGSGSNNFYVDDITLAASLVGMEDVERQIGLSIAPNPTADMTTVTMSLPEAANVQMEMVDLLGKRVSSLISREMANGTHKFDIDLHSFNAGIYYLRIMVDNDMIVKKVVKN